MAAFYRRANTSNKCPRSLDTTKDEPPPKTKKRKKKLKNQIEIDRTKQSLFLSLINYDRWMIWILSKMNTFVGPTMFAHFVEMIFSSFFVLNRIEFPSPNGPDAKCEWPMHPNGLAFHQPRNSIIHNDADGSSGGLAECRLDCVDQSCALQIVCVFPFRNANRPERWLINSIMVLLIP